MAMRIDTQTTPAIAAKTEYNGSTTLNINSGKSLKIETTPQGDEILNIAVPSGKKWKVSLKVHITETNQ